MHTYIYNIYIYICIYIYMLSWKQCVLPVITAMALWQLMHLGPWAIGVITGRAHCFNNNIYITFILLLWDLNTLCVVDHLWLLIYIYIYIYIYIKHIIYITCIIYIISAPFRCTSSNEGFHKIDSCVSVYNNCSYIDIY